MIHYSDASWASNEEKREIKLIRFFGRKKAGLILKILGKIKALLVYYGKVLLRTLSLIFFPIRFFVSLIYKRNKQADYDKIIREIKTTKKDNIVFIHKGWMGVESSTRELLGDVVTIEDYKITDDLSKIVEAIKRNKKIKMVIFSAFGIGWEYLARKIRNECPNMIIKVFWHGSNAMHIEGYDWDRFSMIFTLLEQNVINSIAFAKKSMYEQYKKLGYKVEFLPNTVNIRGKDKIIKQRKKHDGLRVGIYASGDRWVKNMYNQMAAASLLSDVVLDMIPLSQTALQFAKILKLSVTGENKNIEREEMFRRLIDNDIVLYTTFVECAPVLPLECLELGVLCITGDNHHYWTGTPLEEYLVEPEVDNPVAVAHRAKKCLEQKEKVLSLYNDWKKQYDKYCKIEVDKFLKVN